MVNLVASFAAQCHIPYNFQMLHDSYYFLEAVILLESMVLC